MTVEEYFGDKIESEVCFYETRLAAVGPDYRSEVARAAAQFEDPALAAFFIETTDQKKIAAVLSHIRWCLAQGQIIEADQELGQLKRELDLVEQHLSRRYLTTGIKVASGGRKGAASKHGSEESRAELHARMKRHVEQEMAKGSSISDAERSAAKAFSTSSRTVRKARRGK